MTIGLAAALLLAFVGRSAGISGIFAGVVQPSLPERGWRAAFLVGLVVGGLVLRWLRPEAFGGALTGTPLVVLVGAGLLVGTGTELGKGCTSGHGICGLARGSPRSAAATAVFMGMAAVVVFLTGLRGAP